MNNLLAWWELAGNPNDSSGNGYNGTNNGCNPAIDRFGNPNSAYSFNSTSSYVSISPYPTVVATITITAWIYPTSVTQTGFGSAQGGTIIDGNEDAGVYGYSLAINGARKIWWWPTGFQDLFSTGTVALNAWTHIAIAINGSTVTMYINGVQDSQQSSAATHTPMFMNIGKESWIAGFWGGSLADVRFYGAVLSANAIELIYQQFNQASNFFDGA